MRIMQISIIAWYARCVFFITAWVMPMIEGVIPAILCNSLHWSRSCRNVWNVKWPGNVSDSMGVGEYHGSCLLRLSWSITWTDFERMNTLRTINSLARREWSRSVLDAALRGIARMVFLASAFGRFWWGRTRVLIQAWVRIWPLHMPPPPPLSSGSKGKSGAEWVCPGSRSWGVACNLQGLG